MFIRKSRVLHCVLADEKYIHYLKTERISVILNEISRQPVRLCQEAKLRVLELIRLVGKRWPWEAFNDYMDIKSRVAKVVTVHDDLLTQ